MSLVTSELVSTAFFTAKLVLRSYSGQDENDAGRGAVRRIYQGVLYFQNCRIPRSASEWNSLFVPVRQMRETRCWWRSWWRQCAASWKVAGSIPLRNIEIFYWHNPSRPHYVPLIEISTRNISWGVKAAGACDWQSDHLHVTIVLKSGSLSLLEPSGCVQACNGVALPLPLD